MKFSTRHLIYIIIVGALALLLAPCFSHDQQSWFFPAVFLFALALPFEWQWQNLVAILLSGLMTGMLVVTISAGQAFGVTIAFLLFFVILITIELSIRLPRYYYLMQGMNVLVICATFFMQKQAVPISLFLPIMAAAMLAILCQIVLLRKLLRHPQKSYEVAVIKRLHAVQQDIFACFAQHEYEDNMYLLEHRLHVAKANYFNAMNKLCRVAGYDAYRLRELFDILMDMAQLRKRVTDYHVFAICQREIEAINQEFARLFAEMRLVTLRKLEKVDAYPLEEKATLLSNHLHGILGVATNEPLAFLLFIAGINNFCKEVECYV